MKKKIHIVLTERQAILLEETLYNLRTMRLNTIKYHTKPAMRKLWKLVYNVMHVRDSAFLEEELEGSIPCPWCAGKMDLTSLCENRVACVCSNCGAAGPGLPVEESLTTHDWRS